MLRPSFSKLEKRLVWIMGSPRSGSTWLADLISDDSHCVRIPEPLIGLHLGTRSTAIAQVPERQMISTPRVLDLRKDEHYFFSPEWAHLWTPTLRQLILRRFSAYSASQTAVYLVHEPNGSDGADIIMRTLPRSRLIFLLRDGRDVVDSILDSYKPGSWLDIAFGVGRDLTATDRLAVIESESYRWLTRTRVIQSAFDSHRLDLRWFVRYEDLLSDTKTELAKILEWINLMPATGFEDRVTTYSFNRIPKEEQGSGRFRRAASPGIWRHSWTPEEKQVCAQILDPILRAYGYEETK